MTFNSTPEPASNSRLRNFLIALAAIALSVGLALSFRTQAVSASLNDLALKSTPYQAALTNGKPTLLEFYANWCTSCQTMAPSIEKIETEFADKVNFVMLNVDNNKWLPELMKFRVDGIPHFVFMDKQGEAIANSIGEQPEAVLVGNLNALLQNKPLPFNQSGTASRLESMASAANAQPKQDDPRSHGAQVVN